MSNHKATRAAYKGKISQILNQVKNSIVEVDLDIYEEILGKLRTYYEKYNEAYFMLLEDERFTDDKDNEMVDQIYYEAIKLIKGTMRRLNSQPSEAEPTLQPMAMEAKVNVTLPKINIPVFSHGNEEYGPFKELFKSLIMENESIPEVQKLLYLKTSVKGEAFKLLENIPVSGENLRLAWEVLDSRYANKAQLIKNIIKTLLNNKPIQHSNNLTNDLREMYTNTYNSWNKLKNLNLTPQQILDILMINMVEQRLDYGTKRALEFGSHAEEIQTFEEFLDSVKVHCEHLENLNHFKKTGPSLEIKRRASFHISNDSKAEECTYCKLNNHKITNCYKFNNLLNDQKYQYVKEHKLCIKCLKGHTDSCRSDIKCKYCAKDHHSQMHFRTKTESSSNINVKKDSNNNFTNNKNKNSANNGYKNKTNSKTDVNDNEASTSANTTVSSNNASSNQSTVVLLGTIQAYVYNVKGQKKVARILLDQGSQTSFCTEQFAEQLNLKPIDAKLQIRGIAEKASVSNKMLKLRLTTLNNKNKFNIKCHILPKITGDLPQLRINKDKLRLPENCSLADIEFNIPGRVDILLGADYAYDILLEGIVRLGKNLPILQNSKFGHILCGSVPRYALTDANSFVACVNNVHSTFSLHSNTESSLEKYVKKFWELESIPEVMMDRTQDEVLEEHFQKNTIILQDGAYQVTLPENDQIKDLGSSRCQAEKRFRALENKFRTAPEAFLEYKQVIQEYIDSGHVEKVETRENSQEYKNVHNVQKYYMPHFAVIKTESSSTKVRVVFDCSAKTNTGLSLNDVLYKGMQVQPNLYEILLRFHTFDSTIGPSSSTGTPTDTCNFLLQSIGVLLDNNNQNLYPDELCHLVNIEVEEITEAGTSRQTPPKIKLH
ncbi:uncharacterized protein [Diabrotica undecimpunctata]|uniref:uncharacterized protein n=1 Tax=Diabrotica undecimpunctata TaxID=50387 RepID=UPI003B639D0A